MRRGQDDTPVLMVVVDTEEEFDWDKPLSPNNTGVTSIKAQPLAHEVFARYGLIPTYVVDYPVASTESSIAVLKTMQDQGQCVIGAHLHPWVSPPQVEELAPANSYPGNLPPELERQKLEILTAEIERNFGRRPDIYKAGRYGVGPATASILEDLGYRIDLSVVPRTWFTADGGPDFRDFDHRPFWFGPSNGLLEIPLSCGFHGVLWRAGPVLYPRLAGRAGVRLRLPGIFSRLGLLERIRLTPEGARHHEHRRITLSLLKQGCRVFSLTYHSPSLVPGHTPYVRDDADLETFLGDLDRYLDFFINEVGGRPTTPTQLYDEALAAHPV
jgi:hypothetical protein